MENLEEVFKRLDAAEEQLRREGLATGLYRVLVEIELAMWAVEERRRGAWVGWLRRRTVSRLGRWLEAR